MKKIIFSCLFCRHHKECWFDNSLTSKNDNGSRGLTTYRHKKTGGRASLVSFDCRSISCWYWMGGSTWHGPCIEPTRLLSLWFDSYTCTRTIMSLWWSKPHCIFYSLRNVYCKQQQQPDFGHTHYSLSYLWLNYEILCSPPFHWFSRFQLICHWAQLRETSLSSADAGWPVSTGRSDG